MDQPLIVRNQRLLRGKTQVKFQLTSKSAKIRYNAYTMAESLDVCPCGECVKQMGARDIKVGRVGLCERIVWLELFVRRLKGRRGRLRGGRPSVTERLSEGCKTQATLASVRALALALSGLAASRF